MRTAQRAAVRRRQRGWAGLVGLLLALVVAGLLVRTVLKQMGITQRPETPAVTRPSANGNAPAGTSVSPAESRGTPMDRARALEGQVLQQTREAAERAEAAQK